MAELLSSWIGNNQTTAMATANNTPTTTTANASSMNGSTQASGNFAVAGAVIQAIGSIATSIANVDAFKAQMEAQTKATIANMGNTIDSYEYSAYKLEEAYHKIDSQFSDKVSERLVKSMKDVATARLMQAESGGSSGDIELGLQADEMFDVAVINAQRDSGLRSIISEREQAKMNAVNQVKSLATGGVNVRANSMVSAMSGATNALGSLLSSMPADVRTEFFGLNTTGTNLSINASKPKG